MSDEFKSYINDNPLPNHNILISPQKIVINTIPNNINLVIDYGFILVVILLSVKFWTTDISTIGILITCALIATWIDFDPITRFIIDLEQKTISITPKNLIKRLFFKKHQFNLAEIKSFYLKEKKGYRSYTRYQVFLKTENGSPFMITDFSKEDQAEAVTRYLNLLLR
jgi:hypothetical protein